MENSPGEDSIGTDSMFRQAGLPSSAELAPLSKATCGPTSVYSV